MSGRLVAFVVAVTATAALFAGPASAQALHRASVWDLKLGQPVTAQPAWIEYKGYGCGSNGGPVKKPIHGFENFKDCAPEASGLHEVYFEYDDEYEYIARAIDNPGMIDRWAGTGDSGHPILVSALFDDAGILRTVRVLTDPRADFVTQGDDRLTVRGRESAYLFATLMAARWDVTPATDCKSLPLAEGETPIGDLGIKQRCLKVDTARNLSIVLESNYYRKPGQTYRNPDLPTQLTTGQFESSTRLELSTLK